MHISNKKKKKKKYLYKIQSIFYCFAAEIKKQYFQNNM